MENQLNSFTFFMPTRVEFGLGKLTNVGEEVSNFGQTPLVVTDPILQDLPLFDKAIKSLKNKNLNPVVFDQVVQNPRDNDVYEGVEIYKNKKCDFLIAIGGGSSIDTAKTIGAVVNNDMTIDELENKDLNTPLPPLVAIPTTSGTGSEVTMYSVITNVKNHTKMILANRKLIPLLSILDPEVTLSLPPGPTAGTGMDALTHAIESYTCKLSTPITDGIALFAIELISKNLKNAVKEGTNIEARTGMMIGSLMAGIAFNNTDLGSVHSMGEVMGGVFDTPHGISMAIFLPHILDYSKDAAPTKYARISQALGLDIHGLSELEAAAKGVTYIKELNKAINIPFLSSLNVTPESFDKMADLCMEHICTPLNAKPIDRETYKEIYMNAYKEI